jgi:hypothetical protein
MAKQMNHVEYVKDLQYKNDDQLRFIMKDCQEAIEAMPDGENVPYYLDEIHYCSQELSRRLKSVKYKVEKTVCNRIFSIGGFEICVSFTGYSNYEKAMKLDNEIIPAIQQGLELLSRQ